MIFEQKGCDAWYDLETHELLYPGSGLNPDDLESQDLAAWELFTPNHRILEFYPNGTWSEQASDEIIQECSISIL